MKNYDVIVVGSGPSGATVARLCAKYGFSTIMIDKDKHPRDKPCGGAVSSRAIRELDFNIDEVVQQVYHEARIYRPKGDYFTLNSTSPLAVGVLRTHFDSLLVQKAVSEGVDFKEGKRLAEVTVTDSEVRIRGKDGFEITGEILVGADGASSTVARQVHIRERWRPEEVGLAFVFEDKIENALSKDLIGDHLEFYLGIMPAGYGWIFPKGDYLSVGAGSLLKELRSSKDLILNLAQKVEKLHNLKMVNLKWHLIPIGGFNRRISLNRIILVGDAAGFVDPVMGEGIHYAIMSGKFGALSIKRALELGLPKQSSSFYNELCEQKINKDLRLALSLAFRIYYHPNIIMSLFISDNKLGREFASVIKGEKTYRDFFLYALRRMPVSIGKRLVKGLGRSQSLSPSAKCSQPVYPKENRKI